MKTCDSSMGVATNRISISTCWILSWFFGSPKAGLGFNPQAGQIWTFPALPATQLRPANILLACGLRAKASSLSSQHLSQPWCVGQVTGCHRETAYPPPPNIKWNGQLGSFWTFPPIWFAQVFETQKPWMSFSAIGRNMMKPGSQLWQGKVLQQAWRKTYQYGAAPKQIECLIVLLTVASFWI